MGIALGRLQRWEEAITYHRSALQIRSDLPELHADLGRALASIGRNDQALRAFRKALELDSDYFDSNPEDRAVFDETRQQARP